MKISQFTLLLTLQSAAALVLAAPAPTPAPVPDPRPAAEASGDREEAPRSWRLDCGSPGVTAMCSASNNGAHCDPVSGELTIILAGTCGACKCVTEGECSRGCGR